MNHLYHETFSRTASKIHTDGFKSSNSKAKPNTNGDLYIPSKDADFKVEGDYFKLVNFLLDKFRPEKYPPRSPSIWFYNYEPEDPPLERDTCVVCSAEEIFKNTSDPLVGIPFNIALELFYDELYEKFTANHKLSKKELHTEIERYWENAELITTPSDIPTDPLYEIYVSEERLPMTVVESSHQF